MQPEKIQEQIVIFIKKEVKNRDASGVVLGLSGGLDSAVACSLAVRALGPSSVLGLIMPENEITPEKDVIDAINHARELDIEYKVLDITDAKKTIVKKLPENRLAEGNLAARLRMSILYYHASIMHRLVLGTSDKSELKLGYYSKFGDGACDISPIGDLYKTEVREMARYLGISRSIVEKNSSPRLWKDQTAEEEIGIRYEIIDKVLKHLESDPSQELDVDSTIVSKIISIIKKNSHKGELPPICKISRSV